jgi:hypothetical protein
MSICSSHTIVVYGLPEDFRVNKMVYCFFFRGKGCQIEFKDVHNSLESTRNLKKVMTGSQKSCGPCMIDLKDVKVRMRKKKQEGEDQEGEEQANRRKVVVAGR